MSVSGRRPVVFCLIEGAGGDPALLSEHGARAPVLEGLLRAGAWTRLAAAGPHAPSSGDVFEMLGTGRRPGGRREEIGAAVTGGALAANEVMQRLVRTATFHDAVWHLFAGLADAHTAHDQLAAVLDLAEMNRIPVVVHAVAGLGPEPRGAQARLEILDRLLEGRGVIGTLSGSDYAADADGDWERTYRAFHAVVRDAVLGPAAPRAADWFEALRTAYGAGRDDRAIEPVRLGDYRGLRGDFTCDFAAADPAWEWVGEDVGCDVGHRADAFRQLFAMFRLDGVPERAVAAHLTDRGKRVRAFDHGRLFALAGSGVDGVAAAFGSPEVEGGVVESAARAGLAVFRTAETSREAWLTRRLDGNRDRRWAGEERFFPSPVRDPRTGARNADMSAYAIAERAAAAVSGGAFDLVLAGFAELALSAAEPGSRDWRWSVEAVDQALGDLVRAAEAAGAALVLAGNDRANPGSGWCLVPGAAARAEAGKWIDLAPTLLALLGLEPGPDLDGRTLLG